MSRNLLRGLKRPKNKCLSQNIITVRLLTSWSSIMASFSSAFIIRCNLYAVVGSKWNLISLELGKTHNFWKSDDSDLYLLFGSRYKLINPLETLSYHDRLWNIRYFTRYSSNGSVRKIFQSRKCSISPRPDSILEK